MNNYEVKKNELLFAKVREDAIIPSKDDTNAGYDVYACFDDDYMIVPRHTTKLIPTGIASALNQTYYIQIEERGSTGSKGIKKSAGVIDSGYRGEWFIALSNVTDKLIIISKISIEELVTKYCETDDEGDVFLNHGFEDDCTYLKIDDDKYEDNVIMYPYEKAIAQGIVHEVPVMNVSEIDYADLKEIPSQRGMGALGSTNK